MRNTYHLDGGTFAIVGMQLTGYAGYTTDVDDRLVALAVAVAMVPEPSSSSLLALPLSGLIARRRKPK